MEFKANNKTLLYCCEDCLFHEREVGRGGVVGGLGLPRATMGSGMKVGSPIEDDLRNLQRSTGDGPESVTANSVSSVGGSERHG